MGDLHSILHSPMEQPVAQIFYNSLGKGGGIFYTICAFLIAQFVCFAGTHSLARTVFAFSRDRLLPWSHVWTKINSRTGTPLYAVWFAIFWCIAINLIALGSVTAILGVFNITSIAMDWSFVIPILCKLFSNKFEPGPWHMGKLSFYVNVWSCIWNLIATIIFLLPMYRPVTAENMNYGIAYVVGILACAISYWILAGRKWYVGPLHEAQVELVGRIISNTGSDASENDTKSVTTIQCRRSSV